MVGIQYSFLALLLPLMSYDLISVSVKMVLCDALSVECSLVVTVPAAVVLLVLHLIEAIQVLLARVTLLSMSIVGFEGFPSVTDSELWVEECVGFPIVPPPWQLLQKWLYFVTY